MPEVNCHFLAGVSLLVLLAIINIKQFELCLHLLQFGRAEPPLFLLITPIMLAKLHHLVGAIKKSLEIVGHFQAELLPALVLDLLLPVLYLVDGAGLDAVRVVVLV